MLFTSIYRKKINAAEALIPLVAFNFKTYLMVIIRTAKITSICGERLQMLMHIYCGGLQMPHGDKPMDFASSSVTSVSLFFKVRQPARWYFLPVAVI